MTHFELTEETKQIDDTTLYRIRLTEDHPRWGKAGTLGGWVEKKENLQGDAWISDNACVFGDACVFEDAWISDTAWVSGRSRIHGNAWIFGDERIYFAQIDGNTYILD